MDALYQQDLPFEVFEEELLAPIRGVELSEIETFVAVLLLRATTEGPIRMADIAMAALHERAFTLSDRYIREIVHRLRNKHGFPICTRKAENKDTKNPPGYWWGRSEDELAEWKEIWMKQWKDEIATMYAVLKTNYPRLAGQLRLDLSLEE